MFNSKISNSPCTNNTNLYNSINETANGISRSFIQPSITSTPLIKRDSIFATPPKQTLLSPRRYSLSEVATPPRLNRDFTKVITTGPLLASTRYNVNVSTYEDTKSPGLASRIVQYNEEAEREREHTRPPTHQAKYGSPGLFPVVHLFKKKLPTLDQKPKRVSIRISSPEYSRFHSQEYNRKLLEGIVKPSFATNKGSAFSPSGHSVSSTRSVLDALKEISRKRIHANEEYDLHEDSGKRLRAMNNGDSNKRLHDDSSSDKSYSPTKPTSKKICMYDEYAASCSSMDFSFKKVEQTEPKRKSISISTLTENPKETKQVKLINAETQTVTNETENSESVDTTSKEEDQNKIHSDDDIEESPPKVFDDAPLERIRKNRLSALIGSLSGNEPVLLAKPGYVSVFNSTANSSDIADTTISEVPKLTEKPLVSILSTPKKSSPTKSNKHVHFSVPESVSQTNLNSSSVLSFTTTSPTTLVPTSIISSASETKLTFSSSNTSRETPAPPSSPVGLHSSSNDTTAALPVITFGSVSGSNSSSATSIVSKESSNPLVVVDTSKTNFTIPNFQFKPSAVTVSVPSSAPNPTVTNLSPNPAPTYLSPNPAPTNLSPNPVPTNLLSFSTSPIKPISSVSTSPPKMGGFKFDLSKSVAPSTFAAASNTPTFSFGSTSQPNIISTTHSSNIGSTTTLPTIAQSGTPATFNFGVKAATGLPSSNTSFSTGSTFGSTTTTPSLSTSTTTITSPASTFKFGPINNESKLATSIGFPLTQSNTTTLGVTSTTTSAIAFGTSTSTSIVAVSSAPPYNTPKTPFFTFGAPKTTSTPPNFGIPTSVTTANSFGVPSTSSNFGTPASNFLNTSSSVPAPSFGVTTTSSALGNVFGSSTNPPQPGGFGTNPTTTFDATKAVLPFGVSTTTQPPFGKNSTPQFGQSTTQSTFGTPTTVSFGTSNTFGGTAITTSSSVFGPTSNPSSVFGAKTGGFGTPSNGSNIFGGPVNTQPSNFGTSASKPIFGPPPASPFGATTKTTTAPSFGSSNTPSFNFGPKTTSPSFGSGNSFGTVTTASTGFSTSSSPAFGSPNSFGNTTSFGSGNAFGVSNTPAFGMSTITTQPSSFGITNTSSFGTASGGFNAGDKNSTFANPSTFGSNTSPFAAPTSAPGFGTPNSTSGFGTTTVVSAFAKPQASQNTFGVPTSNAFGANNSFGSAQQPQVSNFGSAHSSNPQGAVFSFGATAVPKPPGVFSFGAGSNEVAKPTFNFSGGTNASPAFGSSGTPSFGNSGPTPFIASGIPQFNSQPAAQGMFSIGSGSSTGKTRTHLKPKRRT